MRSLVIGREEKEKIKNLVEHAEKNIMQMDDLLDTINKEMLPVGDMDNFSCQIPNGYKVVYSIENQPAGMVRHLSISVPEEGAYPHPDVVIMLMGEIPFENKIHNCNVWIEDIGNNRAAINVAEIIGHRRLEFERSVATEAQ